MYVMNDSEQLDLIRRTLRVYDTADCHEQLYWRIDGIEVPTPGKIELFAGCNDLFWWATSDAEPITSDNIEILEQTLKELKVIDDSRDRAAQISQKADLPVLYLSDLFAARSRKMRPQRPYYERMSPELKVLFDTCGPERTRESEG